MKRPVDVVFEEKSVYLATATLVGGDFTREDIDEIWDSAWFAELRQLASVDDANTAMSVADIGQILIAMKRGRDEAAFANAVVAKLRERYDVKMVTGRK